MAMVALNIVTYQSTKKSSFSYGFVKFAKTLDKVEQLYHSVAAPASGRRKDPAPAPTPLL
jgi:hypothetical protein